MLPWLKIGLQTRVLRMPLRKALETASRLGASGVELDARQELRPKDVSRTALRQIRKLLEDLNLHVAAVAFPTKRGFQTPEDLDARVEGAKAALQMAYQLGTPVVVTFLGQVPEKSEGPAWSRLIQVLADLGEYSNRVGAWLAADTGAESGADLARVLSALPAGALGVNLAPGNLVVNGYSVREAMTALGPAIRHVHAQDAVRDPSRGRGLEVQLGRGSVDFIELVGMLEDHRYQGSITLGRHDSTDPITEAAQGIKYLQSLG